MAGGRAYINDLAWNVVTTANVEVYTCTKSTETDADNLLEVYDVNGNFLFSADNEREAREELAMYAKSAA